MWWRVSNQAREVDWPPKRKLDGGFEVLVYSPYMVPLQGGVMMVHGECMFVRENSRMDCRIYLLDSRLYLGYRTFWSRLSPSCNYHPHHMKNKNLATIAAVSLLLGFQSLAAFAGSDVVVKKNADGTVDAYDASPSASAQSETAQPRVIYRLKNNPGTRRISGVSVRTNSDGSIDTFDEGSAPTPIHSSGSGSSAHHARAHSTAKSTSTAKAKSTTSKAHH